MALAVWTVLVTGTTQLLLYASNMSARLIARQNTLENARAAVDAIVANLQLAETVYLETDADGVLCLLTLTELNPDGFLAPYHFYFDQNALPGEAKYHRLEFGLDNAFASNLRMVRLRMLTPGYLTVEAETDDEPPFRLSATADVRYKTVTVVIK